MKIIKKLLCMLLLLLLLFFIITPVMAYDNIKVKVDGQQILFDVPPQIIKGRTMVPLRAIFEVLGATVDWNGDTQTVTSTKANTTIILTINNPTMYVNGQATTLDSPACLVNGRTLVPVRAISEALGTSVDWIENEKTVDIRTKDFNISSNYINGAEKLVEYITENGTQQGIGYYIGKVSGNTGEMFTAEIRYIPDTGNLDFVQFSEYDGMTVIICFTFNPTTQTIVGNEIFATFTDDKYFSVVVSKAFADAKTLSINRDYKFIKDPNAFNISNNVYSVFNSVTKLGLVNWRTLIKDSGIDVKSVGFLSL